MLVFRPIAAIAMTIKNLLISFKGLVTAAGRWKTVVTTEASKKTAQRRGKSFQIDFCALCAMLFPAGAHKREHQCDRDDRKRACQLDDRRRVERVAAVDTIPSLCCGRYGGSVVDRRAGK